MKYEVGSELVVGPEYGVYMESPGVAVLAAAHD